MYSSRGKSSRLLALATTADAQKTDEEVNDADDRGAHPDAQLSTEIRDHARVGERQHCLDSLKTASM